MTKFYFNKMLLNYLKIWPSKADGLTIQRVSMTGSTVKIELPWDNHSPGKHNMDMK